MDFLHFLPTNIDLFDTENLEKKVPLSKLFIANCCNIMEKCI